MHVRQRGMTLSVTSNVSCKCVIEIALRYDQPSKWIGINNNATTTICINAGYNRARGASQLEMVLVVVA